jgi:hypothetical protein
LLKISWRAPQSPSAAKAVVENKPVIAAVNRCATQKQEQKKARTKPSFSAICKAGTNFTDLRYA